MVRTCTLISCWYKGEGGKKSLDGPATPPGVGAMMAEAAADAGPGPIALDPRETLGSATSLGI